MGDYVDETAPALPMELQVTIPADLLFKLPTGRRMIEIGREENGRRIWDQSYQPSEPIVTYEDFRHACDMWLVSQYVGDRVEGVLARHIQELADLHGTNGLYMQGGVVQEVLSVDRIQYGMIYTSEMLAEDVTDDDYDEDGNLREEAAQRIANKLNGESTPKWSIPLEK